MKRHCGKIILHSVSGEVIRASIYRKVINTSTAAGKSEELGLPEVIADNGEHINVTINGDEIEFEKLSGEKLYRVTI